MKLRIEPNEIRFRLSQAEGELLQKESFLQEQVLLPCGQKFIYRIEIQTLLTNLQLTAMPNKIILHMPLASLLLLLQKASKLGAETKYEVNGSFVTIAVDVDLKTRTDYLKYKGEI